MDYNKLKHTVKDIFHILSTVIILPFGILIGIPIFGLAYLVLWLLCRNYPYAQELPKEKEENMIPSKEAIEELYKDT